MSGITTHILDTARGCPAAGVPLRLDRWDGTWVTLGSGVTNDDGRAPGLFDQALEAGRYRMTFETGDYFKALGTRGFYPYAQVVFDIVDTDSHYHVPLLLSPFGYSTYRGS